MSKLTKAESLPKSGHVTEVCKEWLVREDGALAYKLQSQEINDFYKGNRFRNAVVREDFPTALNEQIKEKENAERQAEHYRRQLMKQEQCDKRIAKEIAEKLERDLQEQQEHELQQSELIAHQMQQIYVNTMVANQQGNKEHNNAPPRPAKTQGISGQRKHQPYFGDSDYVGISLNHASKVDQLPMRLDHKENTKIVNGLVVVSEVLSFENNEAQTHPTKIPYRLQQQRGIVPSSSSLLSPSSAHAIDPLNAYCSKSFIQKAEIAQVLPKKSISQVNAQRHISSSINEDVEEVAGYADVTDNVNIANNSPAASSSAQLNKIHAAFYDKKIEKLSPVKYDQIVGNLHSSLSSSQGIGLAAATATTVVDAERHMQQHADDIELYVDPCNYASLQEIGLPLEEIKEIGKKIKQEQKDELLARRLQEMEASNNLNQEERDRMMAIEAQDKELAKVLQDKERAKAKRAKEKARLRKNQQSKTTASNSLQCGPLFPLPTDCLSSSKQIHDEATSMHMSPYEDPIDVIKHQRAFNELDLEAYSNPIDIIKHQRSPNGTLTNGSLTRETNKNFQSNRHLPKPQVVSIRDDDIYTLPVDSCSLQRPQSLNISSEREVKNSLSMSESYAFESPNSLNGQDVSPRMSQLKSTSLGQNSSSTPPYMPIQGTRRSNSTEDRKKKSKDKCTHQ